MNTDSALVVKTADSEIIGVVLMGKRTQDEVKSKVETLIEEHTGPTDYIEYDADSVEYTAVNLDGERQTFYVEEASVI